MSDARRAIETLPAHKIYEVKSRRATSSPLAITTSRTLSASGRPHAAMDPHDMYGDPVPTNGDAFSDGCITFGSLPTSFLRPAEPGMRRAGTLPAGLDEAHLPALQPLEDLHVPDTAFPGSAASPYGPSEADDALLTSNHGNPLTFADSQVTALPMNTPVPHHPTDAGDATSPRGSILAAFLSQTGDRRVPSRAGERAEVQPAVGEGIASRAEHFTAGTWGGWGGYISQKVKVSNRDINMWAPGSI